MGHRVDKNHGDRSWGRPARPALPVPAPPASARAAPGWGVPVAEPQGSRALAASREVRPAAPWSAWVSASPRPQGQRAQGGAKRRESERRWGGALATRSAPAWPWPPRVRRTRWRSTAGRSARTSSRPGRAARHPRRRSRAPPPSSNPRVGRRESLRARRRRRPWSTTREWRAACRPDRAAAPRVGRGTEERRRCPRSPRAVRERARRGERGPERREVSLLERLLHAPRVGKRSSLSNASAQSTTAAIAGGTAATDANGLAGCVAVSTTTCSGVRRRAPSRPRGA